MYELKDNFLEAEQFKIIHDLLMGPALPWFNHAGVEPGSGHKAIHEDGYFIHTIFLNEPERSRGPYSQFYKMFEPLLEKLNVDVLIRIRANNYPRTEKRVQHEFHVDYPWPHKTIIFGINTNNGFTIVEKNKKIESKANRMLFLDGTTEHCSTTCTDVSNRINVIVNYV